MTAPVQSPTIFRVSFLRTSRQFPEDVKSLTLELNRSYTDTATAVNLRTIGIFPTNKFIGNGENWFLVKNLRQEGMRQAYPFTNANPINHGITTNEIYGFTRKFGEWTDGTNFYSAISASDVGIAGQLTFYVTSTQIIFINNSAHAITNGQIVLEWISQPQNQGAL